MRLIFYRGESFALPQLFAANDAEQISFKEGVLAWLPFILVFVFIMLSSSLVPAIYKPLSSVKTAVDIYKGAGALDVYISDTEERQESIWSARKAFLEAIKASTTEMDEATWHRKLNDVMKCMYDKSRELNGQVSGEHGIGFAKKPYLNTSLSQEAMTIMKCIKLAFDPKNILNPGKVCQ